MTARRWTRLALAGALTAAGWLGAASAPASATASDIASGWWWRANPGGTVPTPPQAPVLVPLPTAPPAPPTPPTVAEGNLLVAATPDGATAIAAVRAKDGGDLTLTVADGTGAQAAKLQACPIEGLWTPAAGGRWDDKPNFNCGGMTAIGLASADGATWTFPVGSLSTDGTVDVAIVPVAADPATGATAPFQITFKAPGPDSFATAGGGDTATTEFDSSFDFAAPSGGDFTAPTEDFATDFGTTSDFGTSTFDAGTGSSFSAGTSSAPKVPTAPPVAATPLQQAPAAVGRVVPANDDAKVLALLIVLLAAGVGYWVTRQQVPALQGLGRVSVRSAGAARPVQPNELGLGRFRRPRTGPPPRLF
jgi:hypothetical protein